MKKTFFKENYSRSFDFQFFKKKLISENIHHQDL